MAIQIDIDGRVTLGDMPSYVRVSTRIKTRIRIQSNFYRLISTYQSSS